MTLVDVIEDSLVIQNIEESDKHNSVGRFYPSSVGKCLRAIGYQMLGVKGEMIGAQSLRIMDNGTYMHDRTEKSIRTSGLLVASELPLKDPNLLISGRLDVIIQNFKPHTPNNDIIKLMDRDTIIYEGPSNDVMIVELKSVNLNGFSKIKESRKPKPEHVDQLQLYMHMTGIHDGILLYENKNDQELLEIEVIYDKRLADKVLAKIGKAKYYYEKGTVADRQHSKGYPPCTWCDYRDICWEGTN